MIPANEGAEAEVPPTTNAFLAKEESVVAGGRRERNVGNVALSVDRHARACLPRGFKVKRAWAAATREQSGKEALARVRAALVPHVFRNIAEHRRLVGRIGGRPVLGVGAIFIELSSADGNVVRRRGQPVDGGALRGRSSERTIAAGCTAIAAGNDGRDALGGSLLPKVGVKR